MQGLPAAQQFICTSAILEAEVLGTTSHSQIATPDFNKLMYILVKITSVVLYKYSLVFVLCLVI